MHTGTPLDESYPWSLVRASDGAIWIGTLGAGLFHHNPASGRTLAFSIDNAGLPSDYVSSLAVDPSGRLYVGTSDGVAIHDPLSGKFSRLEQLEGRKINEVRLDSRGLLWIATTAGLYMFDPQRSRVTHVSLVPHGVNAGFILGIGEDTKGDMWVAEGSSLINVEVNFDDKTGAFSYSTLGYGTADGLQACDFNQRSFGRLPSGEMLIGGLYGMNSFTPEKFVFNRTLPRVMFSDVFAGTRHISPGQGSGEKVILPEGINTGRKIDLWPGEPSVTIAFATDNYVLPEKTVYRYRLDGFHDDWITTPPGVHHATYANLAPGTYRLRVKAINSDGYESAEEATLTLTVHPPLWSGPWAKVLYALLVCAAIWGVWRLIRRRERERFNERRKQDTLAKQEELNQLKFKFFTNVSHELRTPLTLILAPLETMIKDTRDEAQLRRLTMMRNNANRLLLLVNQLLDFRKNEVAGLTLRLSEGDLVSFVRGVCQAFATMSERKNIELTFDATPEEAVVMFDSDKIHKVVMNLLSNAFKFTPEGGRVVVTLKVTTDTVTLSVADTGPGVPDADKERVFDRFFQSGASKGDASMTGNGIGLSLVAEYVKLHDGIIRVTDNPGGGAVFTVEMPATRSLAANSVPSAPGEAGPPAATIAITTPATHEPAARTSLTVSSGPEELPTALVVDDSADMLEFLSDGLRSDFNVITAPDGEAALRLLESIRPAIILTDLMMPGVDGLELCRWLKANPAQAATPVMLLTAKHDINAKVEGLTVGADDYVTKPFDLAFLIVKMKKLVALRSRQTTRPLIDPEPDSISITPLDQKMVEKAVRYVVTNIKRPDLSVEELASHVGMSRVHLYKKLKATTGKTPVEFIRLIRLKRGAQMLRESQLNVSEIAFQLGYNSPKYFSKYFKEEFGVLPSAYQAQESKSQEIEV